MRGPDYVILDAALPLANLNESIARSLEEADAWMLLSGVQEAEVINYLTNIVECLEYADTADANLKDYVDSLIRVEADQEMSKFGIAERVYQLGRHLFQQFWLYNFYSGEGLIRYFFFEKLDNDAVVLMHNDAVPQRTGQLGTPPGVRTY